MSSYYHGIKPFSLNKAYAASFEHSMEKALLANIGSTRYIFGEYYWMDTTERWPWLQAVVGKYDLVEEW